MPTGRGGGSSLPSPPPPASLQSPFLDLPLLVSKSVLLCHLTPRISISLLQTASALKGGQKKGWWSRRAVGGWGLVVIEGSDSQHPPPPHRLVEGSNSFKFRQGGRIKKNLNSSSNSARHLCALASLRLFSCRITCIFPQPSPPPPARSVTLSSPFTAGLGCSFRRQTHSVSLLLLAAEGTEREKGENGEKERDGEEEEEEE